MLFHLASLLPWPFPHYQSFLLHPPIPAYLGTALRLLLRGRETRQAAERLEAAGVDRATRGKDGASDHAPTWAKLA